MIERISNIIDLTLTRLEQTAATYVLTKDDVAVMKGLLELYKQIKEGTTEDLDDVESEKDLLKKLKKI